MELTLSRKDVERILLNYANGALAEQGLSQWPFNKVRISSLGLQSPEGAAWFAELSREDQGAAQ